MLHGIVFTLRRISPYCQQYHNTNVSAVRGNATTQYIQNLLDNVHFPDPSEILKKLILKIAWSSERINDRFLKDGHGWIEVSETYADKSPW